MSTTLSASAVLTAAALVASWLEEIIAGRADVPPQLALQLASTHRTLDQVARDVAEQEDAILRRYGALEDEQGFVPRTRDGVEDPNTFIIEDEEQLAKANAARTALFAAELEVPVRPLPLEALLKAGLTLTGRQTLQLAALFEDHAHQEN